GARARSAACRRRRTCARGRASRRGVMAAGARGGACAPIVETAESGDSTDFTESAESTRAAGIV
ncbi:hypothetical protein, partial [Burkholderia pseudomallei]